MKSRAFLPVIPIILAGIVVLSCRGVEREPLSYLYSTDHHAYTGMKLLVQGKYDDAEREFEHARALNPEFSLAYSGLSLVSAYRGDFQKAHELMVHGLNHARTTEEKIFSRTSAMRIFTMWKRNDRWLADVKLQFQRAMELNVNSSEAYYFMGVAFKQALEFDQSGRMFARVLDLNGEYVQEADREWRLMQRVMEVSPVTEKGKTIALKESITRADAAVLFVKELTLGEIYERAGIKSVERPPDRRVRDLDGNPMQAEIETIISANVKRLEPYTDDTFRPDELITRADFAVMVADILEKIEGKKSETRESGNEKVSPFPDVRNDHPSFGAIMTVTDRRIMHARNLTTGDFTPLGPVSGVDALSIIRKLQEAVMYK